MIDRKLLESLNKGARITYLYQSKLNYLPYAMKGIVGDATDYIGNTTARRFLIVRGSIEGVFIEEGDGILLKGWHDIIEWNKCENGSKFLENKLNFMELLEKKNLIDFII